MPLKEQPNVLPLEGEIDLHVSPEVAASLRTLIAKKPKHLVVDLSRVSYMDSSGLAVLIEGMQKVQEYGGKFALAGPQERVQHIFEISLASIIAKRPEHVVVDLSGVTFIDSSGLAVLINAMQDVKAYGGKLTLAGINNNVRSIFEIARLDQFFLIDPRDNELLAAD